MNALAPESGLTEAERKNLGEIGDRLAAQYRRDQTSLRFTPLKTAAIPTVTAEPAPPKKASAVWRAIKFLFKAAVILVVSFACLVNFDTLGKPALIALAVWFLWKEFLAAIEGAVRKGLAKP